MDEGKERDGFRGRRDYFSRMLASETFGESNERELLVDLYLREGEATCCLVHV